MKNETKFQRYKLKSDHCDEYFNESAVIINRSDGILKKCMSTSQLKTIVLILKKKITENKN